MIAAFHQDQRGVVSIEFALASIFIMTAMLNAADAGTYVYQTMQVENAAQMAAHAALQTCTIRQLPATTNCPGFAAALGEAVAATSLGTAVSIDSGQAAEAYYCVDGSNRLQQVGVPGKRPDTCAEAGNKSVAPGDYITVSATYDYTPLLSGAGVAALFDATIRRSAMVRVG